MLSIKYYFVEITRICIDANDIIFSRLCIYFYKMGKEMINKITIIDGASASIEVQELLPLKLMNLECKHIAYVDNKTLKIHENALEVGYKNDILGSHRTYTNIFDELSRINNMSQSYCLRAVRVVITQDGRRWSDNTHWTLSYLLRYGKDTTLQKIPFYVIDFRNENPAVINYASTLFDSITEIRKAIEAANSIQARLDRGWRTDGLNYTIGDLFSILFEMKMKKEKNDNEEIQYKKR